MMEQKGIVTAVEGGEAKIRVDRVSACGGNCVSCKGCPSEAVFVTVTDHLGLQPGETVRLRTETKGVLIGAFVGYVGLAVLILLGAIVGYLAGKQEGFAVLGAFSGLVAGLIILRFFSRVNQRHMKIDVQRLYPHGQNSD